MKKEQENAETQGKRKDIIPSKNGEKYWREYI